MTADPETLYRQLGRLIESMPEIGPPPRPRDSEVWLARAYALAEQALDPHDRLSLKRAIERLDSAAWPGYAQELRQLLFRAHARIEQKAPAAARGAFIPVGSSFDAFAALSKLLETAKQDVLIVDPYMDETALTDYGTTVPEGVALRLMADQAHHRASLQPAGRRWAAQYGQVRPLQVRLAPAKALHDRAIFIDRATAWTLTQSLKDFAKRSPAEIVRADDTAHLKIAAYEGIWAAADPII